MLSLFRADSHNNVNVLVVEVVVVGWGWQILPTRYLENCWVDFNSTNPIRFVVTESLFLDPEISFLLKNGGQGTDL